MEHIDYVWVNEKFEQLERLSRQILEKLGAGQISLALEKEIRLARGRTLVIDRKVPDQQQPTPKRRKT
jgi:hypothetical protein